MTSVLRVLIVDDSAFMLRTLKQMLESSPEITVVGMAKNGREAIDMTLELKPDIITMDIEMPLMNGIQATQEIMRLQPTPIFVISTLTTDGAQVTIDALSSGAVDFILKNSAFNSNQLMMMRDEIVEKVIAIGRNTNLRNELIRQSVLRYQGDVSHQLSAQPQAEKRNGMNIQTHAEAPSIISRNAVGTQIASAELIKKRPAANTFKVAMIGISTGGPLSLQKVIPALPADLPVPLLIVQHMPAKFTASLAERLNSCSRIAVREAAHGDVLQAGTVYIAPGGMQMTVTKNQTIAISHEPSAVLYKPSVDVLAQSVFDVYGGKVLAVMMTGMGRDGADTYKQLHKAGAYIVAQNAESCVVYGMPKAVVDDGIAHEVVHVDGIADVITQCLTTRQVTPVGVGAAVLS